MSRVARPRLRTGRRARERAQADLVRDLEKLARLQPGGAPERPLEIDSPARIDVMATQTPCPLCQGTLRLDAHAAETIAGRRLRVARLTCTACGVARAFYFVLAGALPH